MNWRDNGPIQFSFIRIDASVYAFFPPFFKTILYKFEFIFTKNAVNVTWI